MSEVIGICAKVGNMWISSVNPSLFKDIQLNEERERACLLNENQIEFLKTKLPNIVVFYESIINEM